MSIDEYVQLFVDQTLFVFVSNECTFEIKAVFFERDKELCVLSTATQHVWEKVNKGVASWVSAEKPLPICPKLPVLTQSLCELCMPRTQVFSELPNVSHVLCSRKYAPSHLFYGSWDDCPRRVLMMRWTLKEKQDKKKPQLFIHSFVPLIPQPQIKR